MGLKESVNLHKWLQRHLNSSVARLPGRGSEKTGTVNADRIGEGAMLILKDLDESFGRGHIFTKKDIGTLEDLIEDLEELQSDKNMNPKNILFTKKTDEGVEYIRGHPTSEKYSTKSSSKDKMNEKENPASMALFATGDGESAFTLDGFGYLGILKRGLQQIEDVNIENIEVSYVKEIDKIADIPVIRRKVKQIIDDPKNYRKGGQLIIDSAPGGPKRAREQLNIKYSLTGNQGEKVKEAADYDELLGDIATVTLKLTPASVKKLITEVAGKEWNTLRAKGEVKKSWEDQIWGI